MRIQLLRHCKRVAFLNEYWREEVENYRYQLFCSKKKADKALLKEFGTLSHKLVLEMIKSLID